MVHYTQLRRCINPHDGQAIKYFDPDTSDSDFPMLFCCSRCEHDWAANQMQALTLRDAIDLQKRVSAGPGSAQSVGIAANEERRHN